MSTTINDQKIISLKAENFKRLEAVNIQADGESVMITGKNGAGKSSTLDAIHYAFGGGKSFQKIEKIINTMSAEAVTSGEARCEIILETTDFVIRRWWTADDKSYIEVKAKSIDAKITSPQSLLDKLFSEIAFDPISIMKKTEDEQLALLLGFAGVSSEYYMLEKEIKDTYESRTIIGRDLKNSKTILAGLPEVPENIPALIDVSAEYKNLENARLNNQARAQKVQKEKEKESDLAELEEKVRKLKQELSEIDQWLTDNPEIDTAVIQEKIDKSREIKELHDSKEARGLKEDEVRIYSGQWDTKTEAIEKLEESQRNLFTNVSLPVEGLEIKEGRPLYKGLPLNQASTAEQIKIGVGFLSAQNPTLRAFVIRDASLLDEDSVREIQEICKSRNLQAFFESTVSIESELPTIRIEDGKMNQEQK